MLRAVTLTLLTVSLVMACAQAQRMGAGLHGSVAAAPTARSAFAASGHLGNGFAKRGPLFHDHHRLGSRRFFYPYYFPYAYYPYDEAIDDERTYAEVVECEAEPKVISPAPEAPVPKSQLINIPSAANAAPAKPLPPTIFILANGEQVETTRFLLTAANLSVNLAHRLRTIPLDQLDLDATITANSERGVDLRIPVDQHEVFLRF
jgi:hypothetical protein